jgi:flagellar hook-length control protein FliK
MSPIELNQLSGLSPLDMLPAEASADQMVTDCRESFNDYLQRAKISSSDFPNNAAYYRDNKSSPPPVAQPESARKSNDSPPVEQGCVPQREETSTEPAQTSNNKDGISRSEPADNAESSPSEGQDPENKQQPLEGGTVASRTKKKEENQHQDADHADESAGTQEIQANQSIVPVNPDVAQGKSSFLTGADAPAASEESKEAPTTPAAGAKETKSILNPKMLTALESSESDQSPRSGSEGKEAAISGAIKKTEEIFTKQSSDEPRSSSQSKGHKDATPAQTAQAIASLSDAGEGAAAVASAVPSAVSSSEVNLSVKQTKPAQVEAVLHASKTATNEKDDVSTNASSRLGTLAAKPTGTMLHAKGDDSGLDVGRARFVQRVERAFAALGNRGGTVRLKLSPPELGSLRMEVTVRKGVMKAHVETETKEAKNLLLQNLSALRERLAQQNIKIQQFDVDLRDPSSGGTPQQTGQQSEAQSQQGGYHAPQTHVAENSEKTVQDPAITRLADHNGLLNVIV